MSVLRKMSLRVKMFVLVTLVVVVAFTAMSMVVSGKGVATAQEEAFLLADEMSAKYSYEIKSELQAARVTSESLMTVFQTLIERGEADRDTLNNILQNSLRQKRYIISFCVAFEPNKLDGKDAYYAETQPELYGETGRYAPYWSFQNGQLDVAPLSDIDREVWYAGARDSGGEYITDPFFYEVQGTPVLMTSLVFPIIIGGEFFGIVSSDMALDSLQDMVSQVNASGFGEYTEIYSNSGIVIAHPDESYFNQSIYVASAYTMLQNDHELHERALEIGEKFLETDPIPDPLPQAMDYLRADAFVDNLAAHNADPSGVTLDPTLLTDGLAEALLRQLDEGRWRIARAATSAVQNGLTYSVIEDGYYKVYSPIQFSAETNPWSVAVNVPMAEVLKKSEEIQSYVVIVSVIGILLVATLLYFITRNLTRPILLLADSAREVGEGNFDVAIPQAKSYDEVGILSTAFRKMVAQINDLVQKLTKNSEELARKNEYLGEQSVLLMEARDQAEASNRAKSEFLSNMSHEMRTPLNAIVGMTAIGQKARDEAKRADAFHKIEDASVHLLSLINNVLDMSKMEANKLVLSPVSFVFRKMLADASELVGPQLREKDQELYMEVDPAIPQSLIGDDFRLAQVIINLLANAVKFTDVGGEIGLRALVKETRGDVYTLQLEVSDTGIGISEEQQRKLFRVFEQADMSTSRSFGGTGLGLALSKSIVGLMGGEIWVESALNQGATFFFTVKLKRGEVLPVRGPVAAPPPEESYDFSGRCILLAEDIEINREIVVAMLEETDVAIDTAANGREAYERFAAEPARYDLILMDIQMPEMDGVEATGLIRALDLPQAKTVPIIAMTANVFKEDVEKYLESGINDHIGKPLDYDLTLEILGRYLS